MKQLQELRTLVKLARVLGQEPDAVVLEKIQKLEEDQQQQQQREAEIRTRVARDLQQIFQGGSHELVQPQTEPTSDTAEPIAESTDAGTTTPEQPISVAQPTTAEAVAKVISEQGVVAPDPVLARPQKDLAQEIRYLREWVSRIAATGPGGGAAQIYNLDLPTKSVTADYTIGRKDYYVGVSSAVKTYITLPVMGSNVKEGRVVVIKDESGHAQLTPIKIVGTVDNDVNGAEIRINNGAVQLVYHNGCWRII